MIGAGRLVSLLAVTTSILAAAAACGGDDDGGGTPDARVVIDSGPLPDARDPGSSFWKLSCGPDPEFDAGPEPEFDAGIPDAGPDADAGPQPPPGFDDPCCDPEGVCPSGLECIGDENMANATCRPVCIGDDNLQCPFGGYCAQFGGQRICIPASREGEECAPELCERGLICVGQDADSATCHKKCTTTEECDDGEECLPVTGSSTNAMACQ